MIKLQTVLCTITGQDLSMGSPSFQATGTQATVPFIIYDKISIVITGEWDQALQPVSAEGFVGLYVYPIMRDGTLLEVTLKKETLTTSETIITEAILNQFPIGPNTVIIPDFHYKLSDDVRVTIGQNKAPDGSVFYQKIIFDCYNVRSLASIAQVMTNTTFKLTVRIKSSAGYTPVNYIMTNIAAYAIAEVVK